MNGIRSIAAGQLAKVGRVGAREHFGDNGTTARHYRLRMTFDEVDAHLLGQLL